MHFQNILFMLNILKIKSKDKWWNDALYCCYRHVRIRPNLDQSIKLLHLDTTII